MHWIPSNERVLALEDDIHDVFAIHEVASRGGGQVVIFTGQFLRSPELVYSQITERFQRRGYLALLRQEAGRDVLVAYPAPALGRHPRAWVNVLLFILTVLSTLMAGTLQYLATQQPELDLAALPGALLANWTHGIPFAAALLTILGVHEFGHYFAARHHGLDVSLPYFIPFPINYLTGTLGAVIRIQSPFESRKALFDVGVAGPLAGLAVAIPVLVAGLGQAHFARAADALFNHPLLYQWLERLVVGTPPPGMVVDLEGNPLLMAGWWGLFLTALNLVPISQLDGGHIAYAMFGQYDRYLAWVVLVVAVFVTLLNPGYLIFLILILVMGIQHPPALNDLTPVGRPRLVLGLTTFALLATVVTIRPFH